MTTHVRRNVSLGRDVCKFQPDVFWRQLLSWNRLFKVKMKLLKIKCVRHKDVSFKKMCSSKKSLPNIKCLMCVITSTVRIRNACHDDNCDIFKIVGFLNGMLFTFSVFMQILNVSLHELLICSKLYHWFQNF